MNCFRPAFFHLECKVKDESMYSHFFSSDDGNLRYSRETGSAHHITPIALAANDRQVKQLYVVSKCREGICLSNGVWRGFVSSVNCESRRFLCDKASFIADSFKTVEINPMIFNIC